MSGKGEWGIVLSRVDFKPFMIKYDEGKVESLPGAKIGKVGDELWLLKVDDDVVVGSSPKACVRALFEYWRGIKEDLAKFLTERGEDKLAAKKCAEASEIALKLAALERAKITIFGL